MLFRTVLSVDVEGSSTLVRGSVFGKELRICSTKCGGSSSNDRCKSLGIGIISLSYGISILKVSIVKLAQEYSGHFVAAGNDSSDALLPFGWFRVLGPTVSVATAWAGLDLWIIGARCNSPAMTFR